MPKSNLQNLYALANQPGQPHPEDQYLAQLAAQQQANPGMGTSPYPAQMPPQTGPSDSAIGALQGRYNTAQNYAMNADTGGGSLAGGIASLILAPKVAKANADAEANHLRMQGIEQDAKYLQNQKDRQLLEQGQSSLNSAKAYSAYGAVNSTDMSADAVSKIDPEEIRLSGVSQNPDGSIVRNGQRMDQHLKDMGIKYNTKDLIFASPKLLFTLKDAYSPLTIEKLKDELQKAVDVKTRQEELKSKKASEMAKKPYEVYRVIADIGGAMSNYYKVLSDPDFAKHASPESISLVANGMFPLVQTLNQLTEKSGVIPNYKRIDPERMKNAVDKMRPQWSNDPNATEPERPGDSTEFFNLMRDVNGVVSEFEKNANRDPKSPAMVKTKKAPITTGTSTSPGPAPKESSALQSLGPDAHP